MIWISTILILGLTFMGPLAQSEGPTLDQDALKKLIEKVEKSNKLCTRNNMGQCDSSSAAVPAPRPSLELERRTVRDHLGNPLAISVVSEDDLRKLRNLYPADLRIMDDEVCQQRAHVIGDTLAKAGIETAKVYLRPGASFLSAKSIIPDDKVRSLQGRIPHWDFHVANLIEVKTKSGEVMEYVIDPFMEGLPVPYAKWKARLLTNPKSSIETEQVISRFNLGEGDADTKLDDYDQSALRRAYEIMQGEPKHK